MKKIRFIISLVLLFAVFLVSSSECFALKRVVPEKDKNSIVEKYLKNHQLDPVEGIWSFTVNGYYGEMAIIKNPSSTVYSDWNYVGVMVSEEFGQIGEAKIMLKKSANPSIYPGAYVTQKGFSQDTENTIFVMQANSFMQVNVSIGPVSFVRMDNFASAPSASKDGNTGT